MRAEAVNSFSGGMVTDLYEMQTPENVTTSVLNGTLVTYNGNEFVLQNDMGNAEVGTAYLPKGYVPIGMKEHGGVIYVASVNPKTGKCLIGSFPSPQQIFGDDEDCYMQFTINLNELLDTLSITNGTTTTTIPSLRQNFINKPLFQIKEEGKDGNETIQGEQVFHPGDKFIVLVDALSDTIKKLINDGVLTLTLAVQSETEGLEILSNSDLRTFNVEGLNEKTWFAINDPDSDTDSDINKSKFVQVLGGRTSGKLIVIAEYNLFNTFNVYRKYKLDEKNNIQVIFEGQAEGNPVGTVYGLTGDKKDLKVDGKGIYYDITQTHTGELGLPTTQTFTGISDSTYTINESIETLKYQTAKYKVSPCCYYGVNLLLKKEGHINFDNIRKNEDKINSWSQYVTDTALIINWSYDWFDMSGENHIKSMKFDFYSLTDTLTFRNGDIISTPSASFNINKDHYNGSFEDSFAFTENLTKRNIYLCRVSKEYTDNNIWVPIYYSYVYTTPLFNSWSAEDLTKGRPQINIKVNYSIDELITSEKAKLHHRIYKSTDYPTEFGEYKSIPSGQLLITNASASDSYIYETYKQKLYTQVIKCIPEYALTFTLNGISYPILDYLAVSLYDKDLDAINYTINYDFNTGYENETSGINSLDYQPFNKTEASKDSNVFTLKGTVKRELTDSSSDILKTRNIQKEGLFPVYEPDDDVYNSKLFSFEYKNGQYDRLISANDEYTWYNVKIVGDELLYDGCTRLKDSTKNQFNQAMVNMGNCTIGLAVGAYSKDHNSTDNADDASLSVMDDTDDFLSFGPGKVCLASNRFKGKFTNEKEYEFAEHSNWMIPLWKGTDGAYYMVNIVSQWDGSNDYSSVHADYHLRAILSLLMVAKSKTITAEFLTPDSTKLSYHELHNSPINITILAAKTNIPVLLNDKDIEGVISNIEAGIALDKIPTNFLPYVTITTTDSITKTTNVGEEISLNDIVSTYTSASESPNFDALQIELDPKLRESIHLGKVKLINPQTGICTLYGDAFSGYEIYEDWDRKSLFDWGLNANLKPTEDLSYDRDEVPDLFLGLSIDDIFKTSVKLNGQSSTKVLPNYYNELLLNVDLCITQEKIAKRNVYLTNVPSTFKIPKGVYLEPEDGLYGGQKMTLPYMLLTDYNLPVKLVSETSFTKHADTSGPKFAWFAYLKNISMMIPTVYTKVSIEKYLGGDLENYENLDPIYPFDYIHK